MNKEQWTMENGQKTNTVTTRVKKVLDEAEEIPLLIATKVGVWLVPAVPAYFAHRAIIEHLNTSIFWGWLGAIALEVVGVSAIKSGLRAYTWNVEKTQQDKEAPLNLHLVALCVYFASAFLIVLILELWPVVAAIVPAVYVVLGGVAMLNVALADDQKRREGLRLARLAERKQNRKQIQVKHPSNNGNGNGKTAPRLPQNARKLTQIAATVPQETVPQISQYWPHKPKNKREFEQMVLAGQISLPQDMTGQDLGKLADKSPRTGQNWMSFYRENTPQNGNGNGVKGANNG